MIQKMCKDCGSCFSQYNTTQTRCSKCAYNKYAPKLQQRKPIKKVGKVAKAWIEYRHEWIKRHTTSNGTWTCYLQISPMCLKTLTIDTLTLDHVIPRSGAPHLRLEDSNIKPACEFCNAMKGSKRI